MKEVRYSFNEWQSDDTSVSLDFTWDEDEMNCYRFHDFCKRFAAAIGYMPSTIEKVFGPTQYDEMFD